MPGYVLRAGEGEALGTGRLIKASPKSGIQGAVVVFDVLPPGFTTEFHIQETSDEFFREAHVKYFSKSLPLTLDTCNEIGRKYEYVCLGPELEP